MNTVIYNIKKTNSYSKFLKEDKFSWLQLIKNTFGQELKSQL